MESGNGFNKGSYDIIINFIPLTSSLKQMRSPTSRYLTPQCSWITGIIIEDAKCCHHNISRIIPKLQTTTPTTARTMKNFLIFMGSGP